MLTQQVLRELATTEPRRLLVSVHARTDPRDPANIGSTPAWLIELRNGLRAISERLESGGDRDIRLAFRTLRKRIEQGMINLTPAERARSVAWVLDADGYSERFSLQLPLRRDRIVADTKPFVSPLVDIADRGAPVGVILVAGDLVRVVQIEQAEATEPENSSFELTLGDWRPFGGSAGGSPDRGSLVTSHEERYRARVEVQRDRLFATAAMETAMRLEALGWERIVLVAEAQVASRFREVLPANARERVIAEADVNLIGEEPTVIADAIEPLIDDAWQRRAQALGQLAYDRARSGGAAALGPQETLGALAEGRVEHLLVDPDHDFSSAVGMIPDHDVSSALGMTPSSIGGPADMLGERAVEAAVGTAARVTALATDASAPLLEAGGMAALLRY